MYLWDLSISDLNLFFNIPWCFFWVWAAILSLQGGALWFQNLSDLPAGSFGPVFPILVAGFHYINIQVFANTWNFKYLSMGSILCFSLFRVYLFHIIVTIQYSNCRWQYHICVLLTFSPFPGFFWYIHNSSNYRFDRVVHESELNMSYLLHKFVLFAWTTNSFLPWRYISIVSDVTPVHVVFLLWILIFRHPVLKIVLVFVFVVLQAISGNLKSSSAFCCLCYSTGKYFFPSLSEAICNLSFSPEFFLPAYFCLNLHFLGFCLLVIALPITIPFFFFLSSFFGSMLGVYLVLLLFRHSSCSLYSIYAFSSTYLFFLESLNCLHFCFRVTVAELYVDETRTNASVIVPQ